MTDPIETVFRRRMRQERRAAALTQAEFAERLSARLGSSIDTTAVTRMETGPRVVRIEEAVAAAEVLGVPLDALLRDQDAIGEQLGELQRDLSVADWRVDELRAQLAEAVEAAAAIRRRIADLEDSRRRGTAGA